MVLPLTGRTVLVTGQIEDLTREQAREAVIALGGTAAASVTGKVDLVVLGDGAGVSKTAKARSLRLPVLDGADFAALVADPTAWNGKPVGITFDAWDNREGAPEPEPQPVIDYAHRVSLAALSVRNPEAPTGYDLQYRCWCTCGHKWLNAPSPGRVPDCPRPEIPTTSAPWAQATA